MQKTRRLIALSESGLNGRVVLVTGGSRGIGRATVLAMADAGAQVISVSRSGAEPIRDSKTRVEPAIADVADFQSIRSVVDNVLERFGRIDVLVNNAGIRGARGAIWEYDPAAFAQVLAINTLGPFHTMKLILPNMMERGEGVVVNISSGASTRPRPRRSMYGSSKAALDHMTMAVASEVSKLGVRVHAFHPGPVDTDLFRASLTDPETTDQEKAAIQARFESGEVQAPEEPASALAWLASPGGAVYEDVIVPWSDPIKRAEIKMLAGLM